MTEGLIVVYDACVLFPVILRDLLLRLAISELFSAKWSNQIHEEWIRSVLKNRPDLSREKLDRVRSLMDHSTLDCLVNDYEHLISKLNLPDLDDRHVLAVALKSKASIIVTFNLKDFPNNILNEYHIEALHPDYFIQTLAEIDLNKVLNSVSTAISSLKKPPINLDEYTGILEKHDMIKTSLLLKAHRELF